MTARTGGALYTSEILALAVELVRYPLSDDLDLRGEAHSRVCGSRLTLGLRMGEDGRVAAAGARVSACAIGQAAAALFVRHAAGRDAGQIAATLAALEDWLAGQGDAPPWPDLAVLAPARAYPARHAAILLPWKAALGALSNPVRAA